MNLNYFIPPKDQLIPQPMKVRLALLIFTMFYFFRWFFAPMSPAEWAMQIFAYLVFLALYFASFRFTDWLVPIAMAMVALSVAVAPQNHGANTFSIFAINCFAYTLPAKRSAVLIATVVGLMGLATWWLKLSFVGYFVIGAGIGVASAVIGIITRQQYIYLAREEKSQAEISRLAKLAERERIGQDLHDLLGHSLTAIHLKSQVCLSHLKTGHLTDAENELALIRDTAKQSIQEVRAAVTQYRSHSLKDELKVQQLFLSSVGIDLRYRLPEKVLPPLLESDLLMIVREALTNVLRHSHASACSVDCQADVSGVSVTIGDNGKGMALDSPSSKGSGLAGIRRRVEDREGRFELQADKGVTLSLAIPWPTDNNTSDPKAAGI